MLIVKKSAVLFAHVYNEASQLELMLWSALDLHILYVLSVCRLQWLPYSLTSLKHLSAIWLSKDQVSHW